MADELDLGLEEEMALEEETAQEGTPVDPQEPHVQPMETAPEGPEDVAHGGPGEVAHGGPGEEEPEEAGLLGIAQGGLPEAAPAGPIELRPAEKVEVPPFDIWTMARPEGKRISADARVVHPITKELCFPQDFGYVFDRDINHCRKMTEQELQRWLNLTTRREPARPRSSGNAAPVRGREQRRWDRTGRRDVAPIRRGPVTSRSGPVRPTQRQPTPRAGGDRGHRPMQRDEVTSIRQPMPRADPWKAENGWRCLVQGCDWGGPDKSYAGLERHFARRHVPQRVEYVCPYGGYTCSKGESEVGGHNPDSKMARRHAKRWHAGEPDLARALQNIPYVVVDHPDYVPPGNLPPFPQNPRGPRFQPFRAWAHAEDGAGPRWSIGSVRAGYTSRDGERRKKEPAEGKPAPHGLSQPEPPTDRRTRSVMPRGPINSPVGKDIRRRTPQRHNVVVAPLGPSSAEPGVSRDFARERREIEEKKEALQRQISLLDADLQRLLLEEEREKLRRERMAFEEERRRWREDSV